MQSYHLYVNQLESLSLFKHVYVQVVMIVAYIFPWFYIQERLKCPLWFRDRLYINQLESLSLFKHVYVQVVVIVAYIFPWFYIQERLKCPLWFRDRLPI